MEETTAIMGNNLYPITKTTYRCSNETCQKEADLRAAKKVELKKEQEVARAKRAADNLKFNQEKATP